MSKPRTFLTMFSIIAILLSVSHTVHFINPLLQMSDDPSIPAEGDDMTAMEFLKMAQYYDEYDWSEYDQSDFPNWLYMPETYPDELNASDDDAISPFLGYTWDDYDPSDFPNWINAPSTLPSDFNSTDNDDVGNFIFTYMDEDFMNEILELVGSGDELTASEPDLTTFIKPLEIVYALIWAAIALISLIISRSVN